MKRKKNGHGATTLAGMFLCAALVLLPCPTGPLAAGAAPHPPETPFPLDGDTLTVKSGTEKRAPAEDLPAGSPEPAPRNEGEKSPGLFAADPDTLDHEEAVALLDSIQVIMAYTWYSGNMDAAKLMSGRQLALGDSLTRELGDSIFLDIARAGDRRLEYSQIEPRMVLESMSKTAFIDSLEKVRDAYRRLGMIKQEIVTGIIIGQFQLAIAEPMYREALDVFYSAFESARENGLTAWQSHALTSLGQFFNWVPRRDLAETFFEAGLELGRQSGDVLAVYRSLYHLARLELQENNPGRALEKFTELREFMEKHHIREGGYFTYNMGRALLMLGRYEEALPQLEEALSWVEEKGFSTAIQEVKNSMASIYEETGRREEAGELYRSIVDGPEEWCISQHSWQSSYRLGVIAEEEGELQEAARRYMQAVSCIESQRHRMSFGELQHVYLEDKMLPYEHLIDLFYDLYEESGRDEEYAEIALEYSERSKMQALMDETGTEGESEVFRELLAEQSSLLERMNELRSDILDPSISRQEKSRLIESMEQLERDLLGTKLSLDLLRPAGKYPESPEMAHVLDLVREQAVDSTTVLVEYFMGSTSTFGWVVTDDGIVMERLVHVPTRHHPALLYRDLLLQGEKEHAAKIGARLSRDLLDPFSGPLADAGTLIIIPDDVLSYLPFETLPWPAAPGEGGGSPPCLVERCDVALAPSMSALLTLQERSGSPSEPGWTIFAVGDPVGGKEEHFLDRLRTFIHEIVEGEDEPLFVLGNEYFTRIRHTKREVRTISSMFPYDRSVVLLGPRATERQVKSTSLSSYDIIHFATHGIYDDENPDLSGLILSQGGDDEDGFLLAGEVRNLDLDGPLVVLSGCRTGLGKLVAGEGIDGLSRAFFEAGASSLVVSLWEVGDRASADFMELFYRRYLEGQGKCRALSGAKRRMIEEGREPLEWAPFVLIGDYR